MDAGVSTPDKQGDDKPDDISFWSALHVGGLKDIMEHSGLFMWKEIHDKLLTISVEEYDRFWDTCINFGVMCCVCEDLLDE